MKQMIKDRTTQIGSAMLLLSIIGFVSLLILRNDVIDQAQAYLSDTRPKAEFSTVSISEGSFDPSTRATDKGVDRVDNGVRTQLPKKDFNLPEQDRIRIPFLGIDAPIDHSSDPDVSLRYSAWMPDDFNTPSGKWLIDRSPPIIIASHLYGFADWDEELRNAVSFKGLEDLPDGEIIEIVWQQRSYKYRVVGGDISPQITNYDHDLIIYTCVDLSGSEDRIFKYAEQVADLI